MNTLSPIPEINEFDKDTRLVASIATRVFELVSKNPNLYDGNFGIDIFDGTIIIEFYFDNQVAADKVVKNIPRLLPSAVLDPWRVITRYESNRASITISPIVGIHLGEEITSQIMFLVQLFSSQNDSIYH